MRYIKKIQHLVLMLLKEIIIIIIIVIIIVCEYFNII